MYSMDIKVTKLEETYKKKYLKKRKVNIKNKIRKQKVLNKASHSSVVKMKITQWKIVLDSSI